MEKLDYLLKSQDLVSPTSLKIEVGIMVPSRVNLLIFFFPNCYPSHTFEHLCIPDSVLGAVKNELTESPFLEQTRNKQPLYPASGVKPARALGADRVGTHPAQLGGCGLQSSHNPRRGSSDRIPWKSPPLPVSLVLGILREGN